jgi:ribosome-binding ATPase YchF (GTP1/OBG family)
MIVDLHKRLSGLKITQQHVVAALKDAALDDKLPSQWTDDEMLIFSKTIREISKPILIIANKIDKEISSKNLDRLKEKYKGPIIPCSALAEFVLRKYNEDKVIRYLPGSSDFEIINKDKLRPNELETLNKIKVEILDKFDETGVQKTLNYATFNISNLIAVYPVSDITHYTDKDNNVLPDVFLVKKGTLLRDFVRDKIHSDLAKHFIHGIDARTKKRLGENYELQNNDIIKIVSAI